MKKPDLIQFQGNSLKILRENLLAVAPEEGCALLLGNHKLANSNTNKTIFKNLIYTIGFKKNSTFDCEIKILSKLFLNLLMGDLETFEILQVTLLQSYLCLVDFLVV